jgi:PAS domain S-box-containing protein
MSGRHGRRKFPKRHITLILVWALLATTVTAYLLHDEKREQLGYWRERLTRVSDMNRRLLDEWLTERRGDARELASFMSVRIAVSQEADNTTEHNWPSDLQTEIDSFVDTTTASAVYVVNRDGKVLASSSRSGPLAQWARADCKSARNDRVLTIFPSQELEFPQLAILTPVFGPLDSGTSLGCVILLTLPQDIGSRISTDATSTSTGETFLAALRDDEPVFISALRDWPYTKTFPVLGPGQAASATLLRKADLSGEFRDYRGVNVLAVGHYMPELQWAMVTKIDRAEALANFHQSTLRAWTIAFLSVILVAGIAFGSWRQQQIQELHARLQTERKAASELRINEARMRLAFEATQIGFWDWDVTDNTQVWSDACKALLGLPADSPSNFEVLMSCIHPEDRDAMMNEIKSAIAQHRDHVIEYRAIWPDGSVHWHAARGRPFYDDAGNPTRMIGIALDIDSRKRGEQRLQLQAAALEATANSIVITDPNGNILWTNPAFTKLTGYEAEEVKGKTPRILNSGQHDAAFYHDLWQTILTGNTWQSAVINRRKNGTLYTEEQMITPVQSSNGEITHFIAIKQDITERNQNEIALRHAEEKYRAIFEDALVGIYQSSPEGQFLKANPALARIFGYESPQQLIEGMRDLARDWYVDPNRREELRRLLAETGAVHNFEHQARRKDGSKAWLLQSVRVVRDENDKLMHYEGTVLDITEKRSLEDQLRQAQKMEAVGRLAGGIAHDFNNALSIINGYSELLQLALANDGNGNLGRQAGEIQAAGQRAASLTRQLLAFSRKQIIQPVVLDLNSVVKDLDKMLRRLIGEDISLEIKLGTCLRQVKIDQGQIQQVFMNLAVNARDAMPTGGRLVIETCNTDLDEMYVRQHPYAKAGHYVMISVSDTGCGMDKETQARIFEPFFTTKEIGKGTGLGLSTVFGIVKQSDGYISVYSEIGKGTNFKIFLPQGEGLEKLEAPTEPSQYVSSNHETILLVEDDASLRELTKHCLQNSGFRVIEAEDGKAAVRTSSRYTGVLNLLLTDVVMPGMSGAELAHQLAQTRPETKVLFMSGYTDDLIAYHGILEQGKMFIEKPFDLNSLITKVREVLRIREEEAEEHNV